MTRGPEHLFNRIITIRRRQVTTDATGSPIETWPTHLAQVPARIEPLRGEVATYFGRAGRARRYRLFVGPGLAIVAGDRVAWQGRTMEITFAADVAAMGRLMMLEAQEIN